jgi:ATP-dependent Clp protease ATP-binding subunit ClpC
LGSLGVNLEKVSLQTIQVLSQSPAGVLGSLSVNLEKVSPQIIQVLSQSSSITTIEDAMEKLKKIKKSDREGFDKFSERTKFVLGFAIEEAQRLQHNYVGTEHLLLGLIREKEGVAAKVLISLNVELDQVRRAVEFIIGHKEPIVLGEMGLTPRAKKVIELAVGEARHLNHRYIGSEHLLRGLILEGEGIAAGVLNSLGVNLEKVSPQIIQVLSQSSSRQGRILKDTNN